MVFQLVKKIPMFYTTSRFFCHVHKSLPPVSILIKNNPLHSSQQSSSKTNWIYYLSNLKQKKHILLSVYFESKYRLALAFCEGVFPIITCYPVTFDPEHWHVYRNTGRISHICYPTALWGGRDNTHLEGFYYYKNSLEAAYTRRYCFFFSDSLKRSFVKLSFWNEAFMQMHYFRQHLSRNFLWRKEKAVNVFLLHYTKQSQAELVESCRTDVKFI